MNFGTVTFTGDKKAHNLRADMFWDDGDLILPLENGTDIRCTNAYPISIRFGSLQHNLSESVTLVGSSKVWSSPPQ